MRLPGLKNQHKTAQWFKMLSAMWERGSTLYANTRMSLDLSCLAESLRPNPRIEREGPENATSTESTRYRATYLPGEDDDPHRNKRTPGKTTSADSNSSWYFDPETYAMDLLEMERDCTMLERYREIAMALNHNLPPPILEMEDRVISTDPAMMKDLRQARSTDIFQGDTTMRNTQLFMRRNIETITRRYAEVVQRECAQGCKPLDEIYRPGSTDITP